ncbi:hypothetical protein [Propionivibrio sp.]|uniref:hypothetical protein n=1 Tax=Propionivibrio sp. TaxID=2212460 RepID=UPI003BF5CA76
MMLDTPSICSHFYFVFYIKLLRLTGMKLTPELAAAFSPYRTHHANRFGMYELRDRDLEPIDYGVTFQM